MATSSRQRRWIPGCLSAVARTRKTPSLPTSTRLSSVRRRNASSRWPHANKQSNQGRLPNKKSEQRTMPVMRNFRKIMEATSADYGLPASGPGANELPRVLRQAGTQRTPGQKAGPGHAGEHRCNGWCACEGRCAGGCGRKTQGAMNGEVVQVHDLQQADAQTSCDIATWRNRAGVRETGCAAPTTWPSQESSAESRETATAGCF